MNEKQRGTHNAECRARIEKRLAEDGKIPAPTLVPVESTDPTEAEQPEVPEPLGSVPGGSSASTEGGVPELPVVAIAAEVEPQPYNQPKAEQVPPPVKCTIPPVFTKSDPTKGKGMSFDMEDYCNDAVALYKRVAGVDKLREAKTPFCPDGSLLAIDDCETGELAGSACKVLMKSLWLARLARPDIQKPICDLATEITKWSKNCDKRLYRLICYINSSKTYRLCGQIQDSPNDLKLLLFVDADFAGEVDDTKSTNGGFSCARWSQFMVSYRLAIQTPN